MNSSPAWRQERETQFLAEAPASLGELLSRAADRYGEALAIDLFDRGQQLSFVEWDEKASQVAKGLRERGICQGMQVGLMLSNTVEFPITWLALARMGAVMVPINPSYTAAELAHVVATADVRHLILEAASLPKAESIDQLLGHLLVVGEPPATGSYDDWQSLLDGNGTEDGATTFMPEKPVEQSDLAVVQFTSGTTGFPKGCMQSHRFWLVNGFNTSAGMEELTTGAILGESPFFYFDALWMLMRTLMSGAPLHQAERMSLAKTYDRLVSTQVEVAYAPFLDETPRDQERNHNVKVFMTVGAPAEYIEEVEHRCGALAREGYGMTEIGVALSVPYTEINDHSVYGSCGYPQPFYEFMIVDEDGQEQPAGTPGELWVRGLGVMDGYWNNAEANEVSFSDGWFRTGDIFEQSTQGFFSYCGRIKDMIKRSGENIAAVEVESVIASYPGVLAVAVIPVPDKLRDEEVKAVIQLCEDWEVTSFDYAAFETHCLASLASFKVPRYIEFVDGFEYTPSEKIIKPRLKRDDPFSGCWDYTVNAKVS